MTDIKLTAPMDGIVQDFHVRVDDITERQLEIERQMVELHKEMKELRDKFFKLVSEEL